MDLAMDMIMKMLKRHHFFIKNVFWGLKFYFLLGRNGILLPQNKALTCQQSFTIFSSFYNGFTWHQADQTSANQGHNSTIVEEASCKRLSPKLSQGPVIKLMLWTRVTLARGEGWVESQALNWSYYANFETNTLQCK